jgi:hypothetical protein
MTKQQATRTVATLRNLAVAAGSAAGLIGTMTFSAADGVRTGSNAYGDWRTDAPGVMREITVADMPALFASPSTASRSSIVAKPDDAELKTMPRFTVAAFVGGLPAARVLRVARSAGSAGCPQRGFCGLPPTATSSWLSAGSSERSWSSARRLV